MTADYLRKLAERCSETDDGEVDIQTELSEWEMSNLARAALAKAR